MYYVVLIVILAAHFFAWFVFSIFPIHVIILQYFIQSVGPSLAVRIPTVARQIQLAAADASVNVNECKFKS